MRPAVLLAREDWAVLARARLEALTGLFPHWRIWLDHAGWHARRHGPYVQGRRDGAPAYSVHAATPAALAAQLCWPPTSTHPSAGPSASTDPGEPP